MNYYIDCEFLKGTQKKRLFGFELPFESNPTIDLISIGIVSEDGREYYAVSKDFNLEEAWNRFEWKNWNATHKEDKGKNLQQKVYWIRDNVLKSIYYELMFGESLKRTDIYFTYKHFKQLIKKYGKTNTQIVNEIKEFCKSGNRNYYNLPKEQGIRTTNNKGEEVYQDTKYCTSPIFHGYYCDYDWVAFCWLFGKMTDLPNGFPMYCIDLKQMLEEKANSMTTMEITDAVYGKGYMKHNVYSTYDIGVLKCEKSELLLHAESYTAPQLKQTNEHNALADARWNKHLYDFLKSL